MADVAADVVELVRVLNTFREGVRRVRSDAVVPDTTNRESTLLSAEHIHYLASRFVQDEALNRVGLTGRSPKSRRFYWAKPEIASVLLGEALNRVGFTGRSPQSRRFYWAKP